MSWANWVWRYLMPILQLSVIGVFLGASFGWLPDQVLPFAVVAALLVFRPFGRASI